MSPGRARARPAATARRAGAPAAVVPAAAVLAVAALAALPPPVARDLIREDGPVEWATAALLAVAAGLALVRAWSAWSSRGLAAVVLAAAALRELDVHARFTPVAVDKRWTTGFFLSPRVGTTTKAVAAALLVALAATVAALIAAEGRRFLRALGRGEAAAASLAAALVVLGVAQAADELSAAVRAARPAAVLVWRAAEEVLELAGAVLVVAALLQGRRAGGPARAPGAGG